MSNGGIIANYLRRLEEESQSLEGPTSTLAFSLPLKTIPVEWDVTVVDVKQLRRALGFRPPRKRRKITLDPEVLEQLREASGEGNQTEAEDDAGVDSLEGYSSSSSSGESSGDDSSSSDGFHRPITHLRLGRRRAARGYIEDTSFIDDSEMMSDREEVNDFVLHHPSAPYGFFVSSGSTPIPVQPLQSPETEERSRKTSSRSAAEEAPLEFPPEMKQYEEEAEKVTLACANPRRMSAAEIEKLYIPLRKWKEIWQELSRKHQTQAITNLMKVLPWGRATVLRHVRRCDQPLVEESSSAEPPPSSSRKSSRSSADRSESRLTREEIASKHPRDAETLERLDQAVDIRLRNLRKSVAEEFPGRKLPDGSGLPDVEKHSGLLYKLVTAARKQWLLSKKLGTTRMSQEDAITLILRHARQCWPKGSVAISQLRQCYQKRRTQAKRKRSSKG